MDILKEIGDSRLYTLHSHTEFCDGHAQMEAFAREAVRRGFTHYGFTPHSPVPIESDCNMTKGHVADYDREFYRIRDTYGDRVKFYRSMEIDYLGPEWGPSNDYFTGLKLDYSIGSVHFIPSQEGEMVDIDGRYENFRRKMTTYFREDIRYVVEKFYEQSLKMVDQGGFEIIGHLDKIGHNASHYQPGIEEEGWYKSLREELIAAVIGRGIVIEINTKALKDHHRMFPSTSVWEKIITMGASIVVNSDVHVPALLDAGRQEAFEILDGIRNQSILTKQPCQ